VSRLAPALDTRNETELERSDRQLAELMQEVRVVQTGVQVLFGFLLAAAFTNRFGELSQGERLLYFGTLVAAGAAAMLLIAPSSHHRILFRHGDKEHIVRMANRYAIAGLFCVAVAMVGALELVAIVVLGGGTGAVVAVIAVAGPLWCWYAQPLLRRRRLYRQAPRSGSAPASPARRAPRARAGAQ
jgi:Family of unknown function (DUF6328)